MEFSVEVGDVGGGGSGHSNFVQDDPPLAPPLLQCASPVVDMEEFDEEYVANSNNSASSEVDDDEEFVPETPVGALVRYLSPALEVRKFGGAHTCLALTMSQDHRQLDSILICSIILSLIQSSPSITIPVLQGAVRQRYYFKPSYIKVFMAKQKTIT
ncbi:hypothetical protein Ahy_A03g015213 isoform A [Arachis hypogaea]|uniref:Uncharacterized protein n=1 Tax=Arachis hypogaea TaxID=3818 RepID=A0A445DZT4_ARAHY|nr:hypothetical protein Ahy_A03g015213 isoform A [Arachis hypogaea]